MDRKRLMDDLKMMIWIGIGMIVFQLYVFALTGSGIIYTWTGTCIGIVVFLGAWWLFLRISSMRRK